MANRKKLTRKELLKEPDEFLSFSKKMIQFATAHQKPIIIGTAVFFLLLVAFAGFQYYRIRSENHAFALLQEATTAYASTAAQKGPQQAQRAASDAFGRLFDRYAGSPAARIGQVVYADICYRAGDPAKAAALYTEALNAFGEKDPALRSLIDSSLGYALEARGDLQKASERFRQVTEKPTAIFKDDALFQLARIYDRMGRHEEAAKLYEKIPEQYPASLFSEIAREMALQDTGA